MHVYAKVCRALIADRLKNSTTLDDAGRAHFNALASELNAQIKADEKKETTAAAKAAAKEDANGKTQDQ
jgi:hypothetical protein